MSILKKKIGPQLWALGFIGYLLACFIEAGTMPSVGTIVASGIFLMIGLAVLSALALMAYLSLSAMWGFARGFQHDEIVVKHDKRLFDAYEKQMQLEEAEAEGTVNKKGAKSEPDLWVEDAAGLDLDYRGVGASQASRNAALRKDVL